MQIDLVLTRFKERGILRDEVREMEGRTLRVLYFIRENPIVQNVLKEKPLSLCPGRPERSIGDCMSVRPNTGDPLGLLYFIRLP